MYDTIVVGGGPAGVSAAIYSVSRGKKTLLLEKNKIGGLIGNVSTVTHYTGIVKEETGQSFASRLLSQVQCSGVDIRYEEVVEYCLEGEIKKVKTPVGEYEANSVILAMGTSPRKLGIEKEESLTGKGMYMNAARDGKDYTGKNIYVVGGADGAVKEALYLAQFGKKVTIIHFEEKLGCIAEFSEKVAKTPNITLCLGRRLVNVSGDEQVESLTLACEKTKDTETIVDPGCGIFVYAGTTPNSDNLDCLIRENGFVVVDEHMMTCIPKVYCVGDLRKKEVRQVATAVSDGAIAAIHSGK